MSFVSVQDQRSYLGEWSGDTQLVLFITSFYFTYLQKDSNDMRWKEILHNKLLENSNNPMKIQSGELAFELQTLKTTTPLSLSLI